jgi:FtsZ-interacting cell division protein ZipA
MSDLQVALIILGVFIIAAVVVYNWMQERKLRKEVTGEFIVPEKDVLAEDFRIDADAYVIDKELAEVTEKAKHLEHIPTADTLNAPTIREPVAKEFNEEIFTETAVKTSDQTESKNTAQTVLQTKANDKVHQELPPEPVAPEPIVQAALHEKIQGLQANLPDSIHSQIDLTAILYATKNINSKDLSVLTSSLASIALPVMIHGLDNEDKWHDVTKTPTTSTYKQVACSVQLADRGGPIAKNLLNKFQFAVEDTGLELNAHVEWQGNGDALQRAIELDQFCIEVDQLVSVHIAQGDTPIHGTKFKGLAEASGLVLKDDGKYYFFAQGKEDPLFALIDTNNQPFTTENLRSKVLKSVTFQVEIPKVNNCEQVFNQMVSIAQKIATNLSANLVDDNQKSLGDLQIEKIRQQLKVIHATMVARGIMPGSPSSMRLFS